MIPINPQLPSLPIGDRSEERMQEWDRELLLRLYLVLTGHAREINAKAAGSLDDVMWWME